MRWSIRWVCFVLLNFWKHRVPSRRPSPRQKARALWTRCSRCIRRSARSVSGPSSVGHHFLEETNYGNAMENDFKFSYPHLRINIWMFPKIVGFSPKSSVFIGVFHDFHHPFWGRYIPLFLEIPFQRPFWVDGFQMMWCSIAEAKSWNSDTNFSPRPFKMACIWFLDVCPEN